jgi:hypothetical protein
MHTDEMPIVSIQLHQMKRTILQQFREHQEDIAQAVAKEVADACRPSVIAKLIKEQVEREAASVLGDMVNSCIRRIFYEDKPWAAKIEDACREAMRSVKL